MTSRDAVYVKGLYWRYPTFTGMKNDYALKGIDLEVKEGEFFGITGASGSGKTTLCFAIAGLIPHQMHITSEDMQDYMKGSVKVFGDTVSAMVRRGGAAVLEGKGVMAPAVGLVMQDPESQFLSMSIRQELALGLQLQGIGRQETDVRIKEALESVGLSDLYDVADRMHPAELSGGQKQRVIIASFLAMRPRLLILDEPTSDLDPAGKLEVIDAIERIKKQRKLTVIMVEHNPELMNRFADRMAVMHNGTIVAVDTPEHIYSNKELVSRYHVYAPEVAHIRLHKTARPYTTIESFINHVKAIDVPYAGMHYTPSRGQSSRGETVIDVSGLSFRYEDGTQALHDISLKVGKGEFIALVGQNGSGKSTLSKVLSGIEGSFKGRASIMGMDLHSSRNRRDMPKYIGYVFQNPDHQIFNRTVYDEVAYGLRNIGMPEQEVKARVTRILGEVGLAEKVKEDPLFLGKGQKRRLAVASVIAMEPGIIIVDEPTTGQDYEMANEVMELLRKLNSMGTTVIAITHDMRLVAEYCVRSVVMSKGTVIFDGATADLFADDSVLSQAYLVPPQAVRISKELQRMGKLDGILLTAQELTEFFNFDKSKHEYRRVSFEDMAAMAKSLAGDILKKRGPPAAIAYVERGGMVLARILSDYLGVKKMFGFQVGYYTSSGMPSPGVSVSGVAPPMWAGSLPKGSYVLLVDDISDTGKTLSAAKRELSSLLEANIVTAALASKPQSMARPDHAAAEFSNDTWAVFDYEVNEAEAVFKSNSNQHGTKFMGSSFKGVRSSAAAKRATKQKYMLFGMAEQQRTAYEMSKSILSRHGAPRAILYILRGGAVAARLMSDALGVKRVHGIQASLYKDVGRPGESIQVDDAALPGDIRFGSGYVLLVDDISDTGKTLTEIVERLKGRIEGPVVTATLAMKQGTSYVPDFHGMEVPDSTWVVFSYEQNETRLSFEKSRDKAGLEFIKREGLAGSQPSARGRG